MRKLILIPILLLAAFAFGQELLVNGDFEQDLTVGWTHIDSGSGTHEVARATTYEPDPDYEAYIYQYDNPGSTILVQTVEVPWTRMELKFRASFQEAGGSSSCWPAGCVNVLYYNASDAILGETRYYYSTYANWTSSATLSLHKITSPAWADYTLDIEQEIVDNLPGVDPMEIAKVGVALVAYTSGG